MTNETTVKTQTPEDALAALEDAAPRLGMRQRMLPGGERLVVYSVDGRLRYSLLRGRDFVRHLTRAEALERLAVPS